MKEGTIGGVGACSPDHQLRVRAENQLHTEFKRENVPKSIVGRVTRLCQHTKDHRITQLKWVNRGAHGLYLNKGMKTVSD